MADIGLPVRPLPVGFTTQHAPVARRSHRRALLFGRRLVTLAVLGIGLRFAYVLTVGRQLRLGADSLWYQLMGSQIWGGYGYVDPSALIAHGQRVPTANFPPGYPVVIAAAHAIGLGSTRDVQLLGAVIGGVTVALTGIVGRRVAGPRIGLIAAALTACWPALIAADGSVMAENVAVPLTLWAVIAVSAARRKPTAWRWALAAMPLALAGLTRSELPLLAVVIVAVHVLTRGPDRRRRLLHGLLTLGVTAALIIPWTVSRVSVLGPGALLPTNGAKTLAGANCDVTYYGSDLGSWQFTCVQTAMAGATTERLQTSRSEAAGRSYVQHHLTRLPLVVSARELRTLGLWSPSALNADEAIENRNAGWQDFAWWVTILSLPLAAIGSVMLWRRNPIPLAPLITIVVASAFSIGNQRLRLPAEPFLIIAVALAGNTLLRGRHGRSRL